MASCVRSESADARAGTPERQKDDKSDIPAIDVLPSVVVRHLASVSRAVRGLDSLREHAVHVTWRAFV